ncbi:O-methyltransferase [Sphingorhabdus sp.]|uniref:O-methyltransferase n=1 Tax=Sphingorhabdus sp. TaxID=1902408 RepID=UPI003BB0D625
MPDRDDILQSSLAVDAYIEAQLLRDDAAIDAALAHNAAHNLPAIDVSPAQGKMLYLLARMAGAKHILEVGTLGGYSTIWLAKALPDDGKLVSLEIDSEYAEVARENIARAGLSGKVQVQIGAAVDLLAAMPRGNPFDFVFIDADKAGNVQYVREAVRLGRPGTTIIVDNVVRGGKILDIESDDPSVLGTRALYEMLANEPGIDATAIQTVGSKGWDGFILALVS